MHALLAEQDFVRRLAHSLVFDQDRRDDVVQDAWLALLQRPPRDPSAVAGWFTRVVRNIAHRRAREATRRRRRETAAAPEQALPSTADVLAREQQRQAVVAAVLALPEPYRGVVLARFFDDLPPREIARRRAVPATTVRSQLLRGLELLRGRLDAEYGGERRAWCLSLLPLARPARGVLVGSGAFAGVLLMAKLLVGAGLAGLAVLGLFWSIHGSAAAPTVLHTANGPDAAAAATGAPAPAPSPPIERVAAAPVAAKAATTAATSAGLRGRVLRPDGTPAADQLVRVLGIDGAALFADAADSGAERTLRLPHGEARTATDGTFVIAGLWPHARYAVHAAADGPDRTLRLVDVTPAADEIADLGDLVLVQKGGIAGRAVDDRGEPVADAEVLALDLPAALAALMPFDRFDPSHGGMLSVPVPDAEAAADAMAFRDRLRSYLGSQLFEHSDLDRAVGLQTFVVDRLPWIEALWQELPLARTRTAADGTFHLQGVEPGSNVLIARKHGLASGMLPRVVVQPGLLRDVGAVKLPAGEELSGQVQDAAGQPVAGAEVRIAAIGQLGYRGLAFAEAPVYSDAHGAFRCGGLPRGRVLVAARAAGTEPWHVVGPVRVDDELQLRLPAPCDLALQVTRKDGQPTGALTVEVFVGPLLNELRRAGVQQRIDSGNRLQRAADGTLHLIGLTPGCYTLRLQDAGALPVDTMVVLPRAEPLLVELPAAAPLAVQVLDADGKPLPGAKVYLNREQASASERPVMPTDYGLPRWTVLPQLLGTTDAEGRLAIATRPREAVVLHAQHPQWAPASLPIDADAKAAVLTLPRPGAITGRLFDHGQPADPRRWRVVARSRWTTNVPLPELRTALQADSTFAFAGVAPSEWALRAEPASGTLSLQRLTEQIRDLVEPVFFGEGPIEHAATVTSGETANIAFDIDPNRPEPGVLPARLRGRAIENGRALAGARLVREFTLAGLQLTSFNKEVLAVVGSDGSFAVEAIPPGTQKLQLSHGGRVLWNGTLDLQPGSERFLDLSWSTGSLSGHATFATGLPITSGHVVEASAQLAGGTIAATAEIDLAGNFQFAALAAGEYQLVASGIDGRSQPVTVQITAGTAAGPVQVVLQEGLVLRGRVDLGGRPAKNVLLTCKCDNAWRSNGLDHEGGFAFGSLEAQVYELALRIDDQEVAVEPARFDLRLGSRRDLVLRIVSR